MLELVVSFCAVVIISAMCSLFEAVLLSTPVSHIESLANQGKASGNILRGLRRDIDRPLSAILSLNTIANTGGAAIAGAAFIKVFGTSQEALFTIVITLSVLFFSEVIPKTVGAVYNRPLSSLIARPLSFLILALTPLIAVCRMLTRTISRDSSYETVSPDELVMLARLGHQAGTIDMDEARVIQNMLSLKRKSANDVMTPRTVVASLNEGRTVMDALAEPGVRQFSRIPVFAENIEDIVGIVHRGDILDAIAKSRTETTLADIMRPVHFVLETTPLHKLLETFLERRQHMFIVIDEYGGVSGILTLEDILEEVLGQEIVDEFDKVEDMRALARRRRQDVLKGRRGS